MRDCFLILYWPDFACLPATYPSAALVAHSLRRYVCFLHDQLHGLAWTGEFSDGDLFAAHGFQPRSGVPSATEIVAFARQHAGTRLVLAMNPSRAAQLAGPIGEVGFAVEVWPPERPHEQDLSLADLLHLRTTIGVGLLAEGRGVTRAA